MKKILIIFIVCLAGNSNEAQTNVVTIDTLLIGTWSGTSTCQIKNSPCHDETVVYHISKKVGVDSFYIKANKMIDGKEEVMGILRFVYNRNTNQLTSTDYGIWIFNIEGDRLTGSLLFNGDLYRKIIVDKHY